MRYLGFALAGMLSLCHVTVAQTRSKAEPSEQSIARLREIMNLPPERPITFVPAKELPVKNPLKVFGLVVSKAQLRWSPESTEAWVENWNKKDAAKLGSLEAAPDISQADLIFVWFINPTEPEPAIVEQFGFNPVVVISSYLIVQESTGAEILWRAAHLGGANYKRAADKEFRKRMKTRAKVLKK